MKKRILSAVMSAVLCTSALPFLQIGANAADISNFSDIEAGAWYVGAIEKVTESGLMIGKSGSIFAPTEQMTRAQLATVFSRLAKADTAGKSAEMSFTDTDAEAWYADSVGWAAERGIVEGYEDGSFKPDSPVLRQEIAEMLARYMKKNYIVFTTNALTEKFADAEAIPEWASESIESIRAVGLIAGDENGCFNPDKSATRAEIATMLERYLDAFPSRQEEMHMRLTDILLLVPSEDECVLLEFPSRADLTRENVNGILIPSLGLDPDRYELVLDEDEFEMMRGDYEFGAVNMNDYYETIITLGIRNKETGEETDVEEVWFKIYKKEKAVYVDPDDFDSGLDPELYSRMIKNSLTSAGDFARLAAALSRAERGEKLNVSYIGGSITEGASSGSYKCWAKISHNWLERHYPKSNVGYINAGISGTTSMLGVMRLDRDVLSHDPDIIFVEYASNDYSEAHRETFESLVISALESEGSPAVVILISGAAEDTSTGVHGYIKSIGERYSLPIINVYDGLREGLDSGVFTKDEFQPDGIHPDDWGHQIMSDMVENLFRTVSEMSKTATEDELKIKPVTAEPATPARFTEMTFIDSTNECITNNGGWTPGINGDACFGDGWTHKRGSTTPLEFTFTGKNLLVSFDYKDISLKISIDGADPVSLRGYDSFYPPAIVYTSEESAEHTVRVWLSDSDNYKSAQIYGFAYN